MQDEPPARAPCPRRSPRPPRLALEVATVFCAVVLLALVRVALPEPRENSPVTVPPRIASDDPNINRHYDRPHDERDYYFPLIRALHSRWPEIDLRRDSWGDKPPGYPFAMATIARIVGLDLARLRLAHVLWSASVAALLYGWIRLRWPAVAACTLVAPFVFSSFYLKSSAYLTTDNPALLCVVGSLLVLLRTSWSVVALFLLLLCNVTAIWIRQNTLWLVLPTLLVAARLALFWRRGDPSLGPQLLPRILLALIAVALPVALMVRLWLAWGGLVPPTYYQKAVRAGFGLAPLVYCLSVFAICWWPYLLALEGWKSAWALARRPLALASALAGFGVAFAADMTYSQQTGNWGGYLWSAATLLPHWPRGSPVFLLLAPLGVLALSAFLPGLFNRHRFRAALLAAALLGWLLTSMANPYVFHRYYEPYVLVFALVLLAVQGSERYREFSVRNYLALLLFVAGQLAITTTTVFLSYFPHLRR